MASSDPQYRLRFFHGLGDVVLFRNILGILPGPIDLYLNPNLGQAGLFFQDPKVRVIYHPEDPNQYQNVKFSLEFSEPCQSGTATKGRVCLEHEFGIVRPEFKFRPIPLTNLNQLSNEATDATKAFLEGIRPYVVCHFQGTSNPKGQNPPTEFATQSVQNLVAAGWDVVMINYHYIFHHPNNSDFDFVDGNRIRSTYKRLPMEVESLWTLLAGAAAFFGVDSGPLHLALCSSVPTTYIHHGTRFLKSFYDEGLEGLQVVDTADHSAIPPDLIPSPKQP